MPHRFPSTRWLIAAALLYALLTLAFLGDRPISRAQEARVLETARQMLDAPDWRGWMIPTLNGEPRLRKPPLCYWYTAAGYRAFGVSEFGGRLPTLALGWLTLGVTFAFGRHLLGRRGGFLAAATLASCYFFVRFARSAETDTPAMLGTVLACWAIYRALGGSIAWHLVAALGVALSLMTKGGPAVYPVVFLALVAVATRSWRPVVRFIVSGAPLVVALLAVPWFAYVLRDPAGGQVAQEVRVVTTGGNHFGLFYEYVPKLLLALVPWSGLFVAAVLAKELRSPVAQAFLPGFTKRKELGLRPTQAGMSVPLAPVPVPLDAPAVIVAAMACVALPLCVTLNVQPHYLLPMLPACALLVAWLFERLLDREASDSTTRVVRVVFAVTCVIGTVAGPGVFAAAYVVTGRVDWLDGVAAATLLGASVTMFLARRREASSQAILWATLMLVVMPIVTGWWAPRLNGERTPETAARLVDAFGDRPLATAGRDANISLGFYLRRPLPTLADDAAVADFIRAHPDGVVLYERSGRRPPPLPGTLVKAFESVQGKEALEAYALPRE